MKQNVRKPLVFVGLCGFASLAVSVQLLYSQQPPRFVVTPPQEKRLIVEEVYQFTIRSYEPRVEVQFLSSSSQASLATPEGTVIALLSAAARKDLDWLYSLGTRYATQERENELSTLGPQARREKEDRYKKQADVLFIGSRVFLTRRVDLADAIVVIEMTSVPQQPGARVISIPWAVTLEEGKWKLGVRTPEERFVYRIINPHYNFSETEKKISPFPDGIAVHTSKPNEFFYRFQEKGSKK